MNIPALDASKRHFVRNALRHATPYRQIVAELVDRYPEFKGDNAGVMRSIQAYASEPETMKDSMGMFWLHKAIDDYDSTSYPITHELYRDHLRQNVLYELDHLQKRILAGVFDERMPVVNALRRCIRAREDFLRNYERRANGHTWHEKDTESDSDPIQLNKRRVRDRIRQDLLHSLEGLNARIEADGHGEAFRIKVISSMTKMLDDYE